jgi:hypothetical protein
VALAGNKLTLLVRMLGMLGTNNDHERAVVGRKIDTLVKAEGATWPELLAPKPAQAVATVPAGPRQWPHVVEDILEKHIGALRKNANYDEFTFLTDILSRGLALSPRQQKWLIDIATRCGVPLWDGATP